MDPINSQIQNFIKYLRVFAIPDDVFGKILKLKSKSEIYLFSGIIRDFFLNRVVKPRDIDLVFRANQSYAGTLLKYLNKFDHDINSFGGIKLHLNEENQVYDAWLIENTWGIVNQKKSPSINALLDSVFFNFSAIVFDFNNLKFIYNTHFIDFLSTRKIDIVYEDNPDITLCLLNICYYSLTLQLGITPKTRRWIKRHYNQDIDFTDTLQRHNIYSINNSQIHKFLKSEMKKVYNINWDDYLSSNRVKDTTNKLEQDPLQIDQRSQFESDFGRVVFSSPMRRMHDKTQVIPLTSGDKIHTRLTHSIEVMNTAESLAKNLCRDKDFREEYGEEKAMKLEQAISAVLKTAAFVHDIGNPPFGHFGETIIQNFFKEYLNGHILDEKAKLDFTEFDGNAQGFRILTKLSYIGYGSGLNLTYATLATYLKYPNNGKPNKNYIGTKKHGIFNTEKKVFEKLVAKCNLKRADGLIKRHPLSFLVEAADSICYNVMDLEDGFSLKWYTRENVETYLDETVTRLIKNDGKEKSDEINKAYNADSDKYSFFQLVKFDNKKDINDNHWMMSLRVCLIGYLVELASKNFKQNIAKIQSGEYSKELIEDDDKYISESLKQFACRYIFTQKELQQSELTGHSVIRGLLEMLLNYVTNEDKAYRNRIKNIISQNSLKVAIHENKHGDNDLEEYTYFASDQLFNSDLSELSAYSKLRLVVDYVSGMTDKFAVDLYQRLCGLQITKA